MRGGDEKGSAGIICLSCTTRVTSEEVVTMKETVVSVDQRFNDLYDFITKQSAAVVEDTPAEWSGYVFRLITFNGTLLREVQISFLADGRQYRISADSDRVYGNFLARLQRPMQLTFVVYLPRQSRFSIDAANFLLRLVHIVESCRRRVGTAALKASVATFLIDRPRPNGTVFLGYREENGQLIPRVVEYTRSLRSGDVSTPTAERTFIYHTSELRIRQLYEHVENEVQAPEAVEVDFSILHRIIGPLLPAQDGETAPIISNEDWQKIINDLYVAGESVPHGTETVINGDHFTFRPSKPSIHAIRGASLSEMLSKSAAAKPAAATSLPSPERKPTWSWPFRKWN